MVKKKDNKVSEKLTKQQKDINELKKILKRLTTKFLKQEKKKLSPDDFDSRKKKMMNKVDKTNSINELKKLIKSLIKKVGTTKDFQDIKILLEQIKEKPAPTQTMGQPASSPPVVITNTFPQGGLGIGGLDSATKREPKKETKEEKEKRLKETTRKKIEEQRKKILAKQKEEEALKQGKKIRKMTPREAYLQFKPAYILDDDDFLLEGLFEYNEQNVEDGLVELSPEEYIQMLEDDNYGFDTNRIDKDGFLQEDYLKELHPDLFDTIGTPEEELQKQKDKKLNTKEFREDVKKFTKFKKSLGKAYKKGRKISLNDIADLVDEIPYEEAKFYYESVVKPMYEYTSEPAINMFNSLKEYISNQTKKEFNIPDIKTKTKTDDIDEEEEDEELERPEIRTQTLQDDIDDVPDDDNDDDDDSPDFGGGMGRPDDRRRRPPPPKDEPKDEDEEEEIKVTTTQIPFDSGVEVPDSENVIVELPTISTSLTNDIYTNQIPSLQSVIVAGGIGLGALGLGLYGRSLDNLRNEIIPAQIRRRPTRELTEEDYEIRDSPPTLDFDTGGFGRAIAQNTQELENTRDRLSEIADSGAIRLGIRENIDKRTGRVRRQREKIEQEFRTAREDYNNMNRDTLRSLQNEIKARQNLGAIQAAAEKAIDALKDRQEKIDNRLDAAAGVEIPELPTDRLPVPERSTTLGSAINYRRAIGRRPQGYTTEEIQGRRYYVPIPESRQRPITEFVTTEQPISEVEASGPPRVEVTPVEEEQTTDEEPEEPESVLFPPK